ncbi:MAG: hypothetical protein ACTHOG_00710 [Marmoricola sp.]
MNAGQPEYMSLASEFTARGIAIVSAVLEDPEASDPEAALAVIDSPAPDGGEPLLASVIGLVNVCIGLLDRIELLSGSTAEETLRDLQAGTD